jgi:hypothetical protein
MARQADAIQNVRLNAYQQHSLAYHCRRAKAGPPSPSGQTHHNHPDPCVCPVRPSGAIQQVCTCLCSTSSLELSLRHTSKGKLQLVSPLYIGSRASSKSMASEARRSSGMHSCINRITSIAAQPRHPQQHSCINRITSIAAQPRHPQQHLQSPQKPVQQPQNP